MADEVQPFVKDMFGCAWKKRKTSCDCDVLSAADKIYIANINLSGEGTQSEIARRTGLPCATINRWVKKARMKQEIRSGSKGGRYPLLSENGRVELLNIVNKDPNCCISKKQYKKHFTDIASREASKRLNTPIRVQPPSIRSEYRYNKKNETVDKNAEETANARAKAIADIRI